MDKRDLLLEEALKLINKYSITAYDISQGTGISSVGIQKIINGESKRPLERTLESITSYIKQKYSLESLVANEEGDIDIKNKPHDEQMAILHKDILDLKKENEELKDMVDDLTLKIEISLAPILRHFKLKADTTEKHTDSSVN